jgi:hypothetical protein
MPDDLAEPSYDDLPSPRPPDDVKSDYWRRNAKTLWVPPSRTASNDMCVGCHSTGPFIRAGHVHALNVVPTVAPTVPYSLVGEVGAHQQARMPPYAVSTSPVAGPDGPEQQVCTTCHRIGLGQSCERFTRYYTGQLEQPGQVDGLPFHHRVLMPPPSPTAADDSTQAGEWTERYQHHVDKLGCCCDDPTALGCTIQDITATPLPEPVPGPGPASCEDL